MRISDWSSDVCSSDLGEAFFEVTPDASSPFVVYSGDLVTRVVGTSFNIKAYRDGTTDEVSVFTGKVSVSLPNRAAGSETGELYLVKDEKEVFVEGKNQQIGRATCRERVCTYV